MASMVYITAFRSCSYTLRQIKDVEQKIGTTVSAANSTYVYVLCDPVAAQGFLMAKAISHPLETENERAISLCSEVEGILFREASSTGINRQDKIALAG